MTNPTDPTDKQILTKFLEITDKFTNNTKNRTRVIYMVRYLCATCTLGGVNDFPKYHKGEYISSSLKKTAIYFLEQYEKEVVPIKYSQTVIHDAIPAPIQGWCRIEEVPKFTIGYPVVEVDDSSEEDDDIWEIPFVTPLKPISSSRYLVEISECF